MYVLCALRFDSKCQSVRVPNERKSPARCWLVYSFFRFFSSLSSTHTRKVRSLFVSAREESRNTETRDCHRWLSHFLSFALPQLDTEVIVIRTESNTSRNKKIRIRSRRRGQHLLTYRLWTQLSDNEIPKINIVLERHQFNFFAYLYVTIASVFR